MRNRDKRLDPEVDRTDPDATPELELSDDDILDAMAKIPGYIDITTEDFRVIYHLAHAQALNRMFGDVRAEDLMRTGVEPLDPETRLDEAARSMARQGLKSLPVVDAEGCVVGMLTETDFLRRLRADTFLELLLRLLEDSARFSHRCHETPVSDAMTAPPVAVSEKAGFRQILGAFRTHEGRSMPVVDGDGRLRGLLLRKDFLAAFHMEDLL
jgi:CBS domain-containing protein